MKKRSEFEKIVDSPSNSKLVLQGNIAFALVILQRRLASSTYAVLRSLERRKKRLDDYLHGAESRAEEGAG